jgi:UDP-N-acetylmuramoylalanine--D-glutamate ligase
MVGIKAVKEAGHGLVLICGGSDKKVDLTKFVKEINKNCKMMALIPGTGTEVLLNNYKIKIPYKVGKNLKEVVEEALKSAKKGDTILFSPGFASFGMFNNEYERNDLFMKLVKKLK